MTSGGSSGGSSDQLGPLLGSSKGKNLETGQDPARRAATPCASSEPEMSLGVKVFVFVMFTQLGQALMSYDGGATQMSTKALLLDGWSSSELGLLGAMDKFGQVATAFMWSNLLMKYNNKLLLAAGLMTKAASCVGFGLLSNKNAMLVAKLSMGVSEALIGVWATVWVQANAPRESQARWMGLASVSAGLGNGAGSAVAGLCSKRFGYAFAFVLQGSVLFGVWGIMIFTPAYCFEFFKGEGAAASSLRSDGQANSPESSPTKKLVDNDVICPEEESDGEFGYEPCLNKTGRPVFQRTRSTDPELMLQEEIARTMSHEGDFGRGALEDSSFLDSLWIVLGSRLWLWTALAISISCFITSAVAYMWQNTTESVWTFSDQESTFSFLFTTGAGGLVGVTFGPKLFDGYLQGFSTMPGILRCLRWCTHIAIVTGVLGTIAAFLFLDTAWQLVHYEIGEQARGWLLMFVLLCVFCIFALLNSMQGTLYGINTDSTTPETKTSAAALTVSMQNIIGFALGPLLPSLVAELVGHTIGDEWPEEGVAVIHSAQFSTGMATSLFAIWPLLLCLYMAAEDVDARQLRSDGVSVVTSPPGLNMVEYKRQGWSDLQFDPL